MCELICDYKLTGVHFIHILSSGLKAPYEHTTVY